MFMLGEKSQSYCVRMKMGTSVHFRMGGDVALGNRNPANGRFGVQLRKMCTVAERLPLSF